MINPHDLVQNYLVNQYNALNNTILMQMFLSTLEALRLITLNCRDLLCAFSII
jgi:hypothetical protein